MTISDDGVVSGYVLYGGSEVVDETNGSPIAGQAFYSGGDPGWGGTYWQDGDTIYWTEQYGAGSEWYYSGKFEGGQIKGTYSQQNGSAYGFVTVGMIKQVKEAVVLETCVGDDAGTYAKCY